MGNWMLLNVHGTCAPAEVDALVAAARATVGPLTVGARSLCGLNVWPAEVINAVGNAYERDFTPQDVADQLAVLAQAAPSLTVRVHCGGAYEDPVCVATVVCAPNWPIIVFEPEIDRLRGVTQEQVNENMIKGVLRL